MALSAANVRVGVTGLVSAGPTASTAPTSTSSVLTGFIDLGYVSEDGVTETLPGGADSTPIKAWQNGAVVRTIASASEDNPTISFTLLETKLDVLEMRYGVTVSTQTATDGAFVFDASALRPHRSLVVDVVDGAQLKRIYVPDGVISVGDQVFANQEPIGYEFTVEAYRDSTKNYNMKIWDTAAKTP